MFDKIRNYYNYWNDIFESRRIGLKATSGHQVKIYNWSRVYEPDMWLVHFIEKRGLLKNKPKAKIGLYSIFGPDWLTKFDHCDVRIFVARENLHKPSMINWAHQFIDDPRFNLSIGFDDIVNDKYLHIPFWMIWNTFKPTDTFDDIKKRVNLMNDPNNHSYKDRHFCSFLISHIDPLRENLYRQMSTIDKVHCDGKGFHNNDTLKEIYNDDKIAYLKHYRFSLTPENSNSPNYCTEKLMESFQCGAIPVYWGCDNNPEPSIINKSAIIFIEQCKIPEQQLKLIKELNSSEKKYMEFASQRCLKSNADAIIWEYYMRLENKIKEIIINI